MKKNICIAIFAALLALSVIGCNSEKNTVEEDSAQKTGNDVSSVESSELESDEELPPNVVQTEVDPNSGGTFPHTDFQQSFILISARVSNIVDRDKLSEWNEYISEIVADETKDPYLYDNIYEFIRFFDIPRSELEDVYYSTALYYMYDYDFDLLYGDDVDALYEYYSHENGEFVKRNYEYSIKQAIKSYVGSDEFYEWLQSAKDKKYNEYSDTLWSIAEAVYEFDIPRESLEEILGISSDEEIIEEVIEEVEEIVIEEVYEDGSTSVISGTADTYTYDLDLIYDDDSALRAYYSGINTASVDEDNPYHGMNGYEIDEILRKN